MSLPAPNPSLSAPAYALGYALGVYVFYRIARRRRLLTEGMAYVAAAGLIGATLFQLLATAGQQPGKTVLGGVAFGYATVALTKWKLGIRRPTGDLFALALMAGEAVGRFGCYFGGCCYGKPAASLPWAVWQHDALRHPTQLYLAAACALVFATLLTVELRGRLPENGLFYLQGLLYCPLRFLVEFWRDGASVHAGLTSAQWACAAGFLFFAIQWCRLIVARRP